MDWEKLRSIFVGLFIFPSVNFAFKREFLVKPYPNSKTLDGLYCIVPAMPSVRGVKFDTQTETCAALADAWFSSPTYEAQTNYFTLASTTVPLAKTNAFELPFPTSFVEDGSVVMLMETGTVGDTNFFDIMFTPLDRSMIAFFIQLREHENSILYNSRINGVWGFEEIKTNPFKTSNKVYKLEFKVTTTQIQTYIDSNLFYSFNHRTSYSNYQLFCFWSATNTYTSDQVQFTYPDV